MNAYRTLLGCILVAVIASVVQAEPATRIPVSDIKPLLRLAIDQGSAHGTLVGDGATFVRNRFGTTDPIEIDVRSIQILRDPGCRRLEVTTRQAGVIEKGIPGDKRLTYQINYCRDGRMPERS